MKCSIRKVVDGMVYIRSCYKLAYKLFDMWNFNK